MKSMFLPSPPHLSELELCKIIFTLDRETIFEFSSAQTRKQEKGVYVQETNKIRAIYDEGTQMGIPDEGRHAESARGYTD